MVHNAGGGAYGQIIPASNDAFIGGPGAVLDGDLTNLYALTQHATNVTISTLTWVRGQVLVSRIVGLQTGRR
jgi:hypothetical protein